MLLAAGVTAWIVGQAAINLGAVVGLLPGVGHHVAVPVGRRIVARDHDARRGDPRQRRAPHAAGSSKKAARAEAVAQQPTLAARAAGERTGLRAVHGWRNRRSHLPGGRGRAGARAARPPARVGAVRRRPARHRRPGRARSRLRDRPARRPRAAAPAHARQRRGDRRRGVGVRPRAACSCAGTARASWSGSAATRRCRASPRRGCCACPRSCTSRTPRPASRIASVCGSARAPAVSLPGTPLPGATLTGNPVRAVIAAIEREPGVETRRCSPSSAARRVRARSTGPRSAATTAGATAATSPFATCAARGTSTSASASLDAQRRDGRRARVRARSLRAAHGGAARRGRRSRCAAPARERSPSSPWPVCPAVLVPLPGLAERSPGAQRADAGAGRRRGRRARRASATRRGSTASCRSCSREPERLEQMGKAAARARPARRRGARRRSRRGVRACLTTRCDRRDRRSRRSISRVRAACTSSVSAASGMSAIALLLARMGHEVSGSDLKESVVARPPRGRGRAA